MTRRWSELSPEAAGAIRAWAPIGLVSSPHLSRVFGLSPQALKNWRWRGHGPAAEPCEAFGYGSDAPFLSGLYGCRVARRQARCGGLDLRAGLAASHLRGVAFRLREWRGDRCSRAFRRTGHAPCGRRDPSAGEGV